LSKPSSHFLSGSFGIQSEPVELPQWSDERVLTLAGIYGLVVLLPLYFLEHRLGQDQPPAITHPEFYCGFVGVATAWQVAF